MYKNDMKKTWGVISDTLKSSDKSKSQVEFKVGNHTIRDTDEIANHFNPLHPNNAAPCSCECAPVMLPRASVTAPQ